MGVKLVPPGVHYVYCSPSTEEVGGARSGFFLAMRPQEVYVFRWEPETEELVQLNNADEEARYADGVRSFDFDANLGPYPIGLSAEWSELTRHITAKIIGKVEPVARTIRSKRAEYDGDKDSATRSQEAWVAWETEAGAADAAVDKAQAAGSTESANPDSAPAMAVDSGNQQSDSKVESNLGVGTLFFSAVPLPRKLRGAAATDITRSHMDRTTQLEAMITREYGGDELGVLGELQMAYVAFLLGQSFDGFEQWKLLLHLLCGCEDAIGRRPGLFAELLRAFFAQLSQAPQDFFSVDFTQENFLGTCALSLLEICGAPSVPSKVQKRCGKLRDLVESKFGVSPEDLSLLGEDAPLVVDEHGRDLVDLGGSLAAMD